MADIFICYRRDDSPGHAGRLYDRLRTQFGADRVFMDIDNMRPGVDFVHEIDRVLQGVGVVLVVIGRSWIPPEVWSRSRLDEANDFVRLEIAASLKRRKVRVVPVLVHGATMPHASRLPEVLQPLVRRQAVDLRDSAWERDVGKLLNEIKKVIAPRQKLEQKPPRAAGAPSRDDAGERRPRRKTRGTNAGGGSKPARGQARDEPAARGGLGARKPGGAIARRDEGGAAGPEKKKRPPQDRGKAPGGPGTPRTDRTKGAQGAAPVQRKPGAKKPEAAAGGQPRAGAGQKSGKPRSEPQQGGSGRGAARPLGTRGSASSASPGGGKRQTGGGAGGGGPAPGAGARKPAAGGKGSARSGGNAGAKGGQPKKRTPGAAKAGQRSARPGAKPPKDGRRR